DVGVHDGPPVSTVAWASTCTPGTHTKSPGCLFRCARSGHLHLRRPPGDTDGVPTARNAPAPPLPDPAGDRPRAWRARRRAPPALGWTTHVITPTNSSRRSVDEPGAPARARPLLAAAAGAVVHGDQLRRGAQRAHVRCARLRRRQRLAAPALGGLPRG